MGSDVRAVLRDEGDAAARLALFAGAAMPGVFTLDPVCAIGLAGESIAAAHRRLARQFRGNFIT